MHVLDTKGACNENSRPRSSIPFPSRHFLWPSLEAVKNHLICSEGCCFQPRRPGWGPLERRPGEETLEPESGAFCSPSFLSPPTSVRRTARGSVLTVLHQRGIVDIIIAVLC